MSGGVTAWRQWSVMVLLIVALSGCAGKANEPKPRPEAPVSESQEPPKRLYTGAGEATVRDPEGARPVRYVIQWKSTELDYTLGEGASAGEMKGVNGVLYRDGKPASRFVAESAVANKDQKRLLLSGDVKVRSSDPKGELDCQRVEWKTDEKQLKAFGKVTIRLPQGTIGPVDEIWCLPDLKRAGTPGFYQR